MEAWRRFAVLLCCAALLGLHGLVLLWHRNYSYVSWFCPSPSWLSLWSNAVLLCSVTGHRGQTEGESGGGGEGASAYQARGCLILQRHCLKGCRGRQRNWSDWKDLQNAKQGLAKKKGGGGAGWQCSPQHQPIPLGFSLTSELRFCHPSSLPGCSAEARSFGCRMHWVPPLTGVECLWPCSGQWNNTAWWGN